MQEVPKIALENMAQGNMTTTITKATEGSTPKTKTENLQAVKTDVVNVDIVNMHTKEIMVENNINVEATSNTQTAKLAAPINPEEIAAFMGRDDVDGKRDLSINRDKSNTMDTPERKERDVNDTLDGINAPVMRLPVDSSTPLRVYQVGIYFCEKEMHVNVLCINRSRIKPPRLFTTYL